LGVIFSLSGVWEYNGKKKGIEFRQLSKEWRNLVGGYYHRTIKFKEWLENQNDKTGISRSEGRR
jgi:hypothetical protein